MKRAIASTVLVMAALLAAQACVTEETGDFALCCTCLAQKSPINDGDALEPSTNCLPDDSEIEGCNQRAAEQIASPDDASPIEVTDELCTTQTCLDECRGAGLRGARFTVVQHPLSG